MIRTLWRKAIIPILTGLILGVLLEVCTDAPEWACVMTATITCFIESRARNPYPLPEKKEPRK